MKQIGIALSACHDAIGVLPFAFGARTFPPRGPKPLLWGCDNANGSTIILPFLEQTVVYNAINFQIDNCLNGGQSYPDTYRACDQTAFSTKIAIFLCPSDQSQVTFMHGVIGTRDIDMVSHQIIITGPKPGIPPTTCMGFGKVLPPGMSTPRQATTRVA